jgi:hypothetical protein
MGQGPHLAPQAQRHPGGPPLPPGRAVALARAPPPRPGRGPAASPGACPAAPRQGRRRLGCVCVRAPGRLALPCASQSPLAPPPRPLPAPTPHTRETPPLAKPRPLRNPAPCETPPLAKPLPPQTPAPRTAARARASGAGCWTSRTPTRGATPGAGARRTTWRPRGSSPSPRDSVGGFCWRRFCWAALPPARFFAARRFVSWFAVGRARRRGRRESWGGGGGGGWNGRCLRFVHLFEARGVGSAAAHASHAPCRPNTPNANAQTDTWLRDTYMLHMAGQALAFAALGGLPGFVWGFCVSRQRGGRARNLGASVPRPRVLNAAAAARQPHTVVRARPRLRPSRPPRPPPRASTAGSPGDAGPPPPHKPAPLPKRLPRARPWPAARSGSCSPRT